MLAGIYPTAQMQIRFHILDQNIFFYNQEYSSIPLSNRKSMKIESTFLFK